MQDYDVVVSGAGPSGSACARLLGDKGLRVLLVDKSIFPRDTGKAALLLPEAMDVLSRLGVWDKVVEKGAHSLEGLAFFHEGKEWESAHRPTTPHLAMASVPRKQVDNILFEHATKGCEFRESVQVTGVNVLQDKVEVRLADLSTRQVRTVTCDMVVGADGAFSEVARSLGGLENPAWHTMMGVQKIVSSSPTESKQGDIHFHEELGPGYTWMVPLEKGQVSVGACVSPVWMDRHRVDLVEWMEKWMSTFEWTHPSSPNSLSSGWEEQVIPLRGSSRPRVFNRALLIGDAAGVAHSFSGMGIGDALTSSWMAGETIWEAYSRADFSRASLSAYDHRLQTHLQRHPSPEGARALMHIKPIWKRLLCRADTQPALSQDLSHLFFPSEKESRPVSAGGLIKNAWMGR
ncbi:MAG: NAD(P)/FAD-dependent oxidoreductase [Candidatus Diapherotrites archaeon]|nr:NAD(P)/FAD-dependent oxidoreductase [Candidatus Diapherotrites archaeon]MDZ4255999.1 NAD(P)/FAD-dependent oxidoreductase [archaeon]